jgi:Rhodopirellula transposase DDE domain
VSLGVSELDSGAELLGRAWRPGGGRKRAADTDPGLRPALLALAAEHTAQGHKVSADMVGDLRRADGFSLQGNAKTIEGKQHPDQDAQFRHINEHVKAHQDGGDSVISVDQEEGAGRAVQERVAGCRGAAGLEGPVRLRRNARLP